MQYCNYAYFAINTVSIIMILREHKSTVTFELDGDYQVKNIYKQLVGV